MFNCATHIECVCIYLSIKESLYVEKLIPLKLISLILFYGLQFISWYFLRKLRLVEERELCYAKYPVQQTIHSYYKSRQFPLQYIYPKITPSICSYEDKALIA